jgi:tight adherence protein C
VLDTWFAGLQPQPLHIAGLISVVVFLSAMLLAHGVRAREALRRRALAPGAISAQSAAGDKERRSLQFADEQRISRFVERAGRLLAPTSRQDLTAIRNQLVQAGFMSPAAVPVFYTLRILLAGALPVLFLLSSGVLPFEFSGTLTLAAAAMMGVVGLILPAVLLDRMRSKMRERYRQAFPDFMDLIVVCIESGLGLNAAIERVGREILQSCPPLGANLHLLCLELRAGRTLTEALDGLAERVGIEEVKSLKLMLKQSEELGASIAATLRVYSDEMRDKRLMRAEAKAHALPVKMTLPLGAFIFPVILMVIMVPLIIRIKNAFV